MFRKWKDKAIDFTLRLVNARLLYFCKVRLYAFVETEVAEVSRLLFYATMGNPRNLGHILYNLYESHLVYKKPIGYARSAMRLENITKIKLSHFLEYRNFGMSGSPKDFPFTVSRNF